MSKITIQIFGAVAPASLDGYMDLRGEIQALSGEISLPTAVDDRFMFELLTTKGKEGGTPEEERKRKEEILRKIGGWIRAAVVKEGLRIRLDGEVQSLPELDLLKTFPVGVPEDFQIQYIPRAYPAGPSWGGHSLSEGP